ncbi:50S ribosomal protein L10 [Verrucomicrobiota bacterium]
MRPEKEAIVRDIHDSLEGSSYVILADYSGLTVEGLTELRSRLRPVKGRLTVVKNAFLARAAERLKWNGLPTLISGSTAVISGDGDVTQVAKILVSFRKEFERPTLKGGRIGSDTVDSAGVGELAMIPPREIMLGRLVGTVAAPLSQVVGVLNQKVASLLYVLKAIEEKKNKA